MEENIKNEYIEKIEAALNLIRPYLQADGGDVSFVNLRDDFVVEVKLLGTCDGCPMSVQTLKAGVEQTIKRSIPNIKEVISIN
jgi:Fe-S cluster biogenesis protein NfuA